MERDRHVLYGRDSWCIPPGRLTAVARRTLESGSGCSTCVPSKKGERVFALSPLSLLHSMKIGALQRLEKDIPAFSALQHLVGPVRFEDVKKAAQQNEEPLYKMHEISKGDGRTRTLHIPHPALKEIQQQLVTLFNGTPVHRPVYGFTVGTDATRGLRDMLTIYREKMLKPWIASCLQMDIHDFFPSIDYGEIQSGIRRCIMHAVQRSRGVALPHESTTTLTDALAELCTHEERLPQGAPTSPALSNLASHWMDTDIWEISKKEGAVWGRYADDIVLISTKHITHTAQDAIQEVLGNYELEEATHKREWVHHPDSLSIWGMHVLPPKKTEDPIRFRIKGKYEDELYERVRVCSENFRQGTTSAESLTELRSVCGHLAHASHIGRHGCDVTGPYTNLRPRLEHQWHYLRKNAAQSLPGTTASWYGARTDFRQLYMPHPCIVRMRDSSHTPH